MRAQCNIGRVDRYRLAPLRDARERDARDKRGDLAAAVGEARETATRLEAAAHRVEDARVVSREARAAIGALLEGGARGATLALADRHAQRRRRDLEAALGEQLRARAAHGDRLAEVDEARGRLVIARAERELIERHFARWRTARARLAERRED